ncbi:MAG: DNA mismatch repair protein MutS [Planctomycetaceae bacterium]
MTKSAAKLTPMMQRYREVKEQNPGTLLLFRMGDFYELFYDDAKIAARILGLTLTSRDKGSANPVAMAGFPYHALENYLQKLIRAGFRAAICDQVEDPKKAKGLVRREVTRVVTPGTLTDEALLDPRTHNFLAAVSPGKDSLGLAWLELSSGEFYATTTTREYLFDELARIRPAECLLPEGDLAEQWKAANPSLQKETVFTERPAWAFQLEECRRRLLKHFETATLEGFGFDDDSPSLQAAGALLEYIQETQKSSLGHIRKISPYERGQTLLIDEASRRSLELTRTMRDGTRDGSLLAILDETVTPMGARLLADWLSNPLTNRDDITARLDAVEELHNDVVLTREIREQLKGAYDVSRLTARIATGRASPRDLGSLAATLALLPKLKVKLSGRKSSLLAELENQLDLCPEVRADIESALVDEPPVTITDGGLIREGYRTELDQLRELARGGKEWMARYQAEETERTGIPNLKIGYNRVFGYYLEVTAAHRDKVPENYIRKQTLKNQERFVTPELKEYEEKVLRAEEQAISLEQELFQQLRDRVNAECARLQQTASVLSQTDVLATLAMLASSRGYCRPLIHDEPIIDIRDGRHPVLDHLQPSGEFVPNDVRIGVPENETSENAPAETFGKIQIITGPNMAGKSTYIRQAALLTVMAQMGSFVPAREAVIGIADQIFARVGASDELGKGQSTFMVEMTETACILNSATARSLVILDEIGRGTSTYDGISLAWAVTEYLHDIIGCRTLFATHYHELTDLTQTLKQACNWTVAVREHEDNVIFLHKIVPGTADKSYGIHVARLAGVPRAVIDRARVVLDTLETEHLDEGGKPHIPDRPTRRTDQQQLSLFGTEEHPLLDDIRELDIDRMTPLAALEKLNTLREKLRKGQ